MLRSRKLPPSQLNCSEVGCPAAERLLHLMDQIKSYLSAKEFPSLSFFLRTFRISHCLSFWIPSSFKPRRLHCLHRFIRPDFWHMNSSPLWGSPGRVQHAFLTLLTAKVTCSIGSPGFCCCCFPWKMLFSFLISFRLRLKMCSACHPEYSINILATSIHNSVYYSLLKFTVQV